MKVLRDFATLLMYVELPLLQNSELCSCHILFAFCCLQAVTNCCFRHFLARSTTYFTPRFRKWYFSICQAIYQVRYFQMSNWEFIINTILNFQIKNSGKMLQIWLAIIITTSQFPSKVQYNYCTNHKQLAIYITAIFL